MKVVGWTRPVESRVRLHACDITVNAHHDHPPVVSRELATVIPTVQVLSPTRKMDVIQHIISNPAYHDYLGILKGARNGFVYGVKIRFPHALIMAILFGRGE